MQTVAVIQARMGSSRLPGKVLELIAGRPLILWTLAAVSATPGIEAVVVATTKEAEDDRLVSLLNDAVVPTHRGPVDDVLRRIVDAAEPYAPAIVVRQTADNPFPDPAVMGAQLERLVEGGFDYVGIAGLPLGIAAEAVTWPALVTADREATEPADREHVTRFIRRQPDRFRTASATPVDGPADASRGRYTVDTPADLAFARRIAEAIGHPPPVRLAELEAIRASDPSLSHPDAGR